MKSKVLAGLAVLSLLGIACGDDTSSTGGSGTGGAATGGNGGNGTGGTPVTTVGGGGAGGGMTGDGNDSFADADPIVVGDPAIDGALDPVATDLDFYTFDGTAGQAIEIITDAKSGILNFSTAPDPFADGYLDLVIELYDSNMTLIATSDDPIPRNSQDSLLLTVLPTTGAYYIKVSEFCLSWPEGPLGSMCYADTDIVDPTYAIGVIELDPTQNSIIQQVEPNDTDLTATPWEFELNMPGQYFASINYGDFGAAADVDYYAFTPPADVDLDVQGLFTGRLNADFTFYPSGPTGNGAAADVGVVQLVDAGSGFIVAELDVGAVMDPTFGAQMSVPVIGGHDYYLVSDSKSGSAFGAGYFYFTFQTVGPNNPIENDPMFAAGGAGNDGLSAADDMYEQTNMDMDMSTSWFIEGDIDTAGDIDFYNIPLNGQPLLSVSCGGINQGSGLAVKASLVDDTGATIPGATATETLNQMEFIKNVDAPAMGPVYLRIERGAQSPTVAGAFYRCGVSNYTTPAP